MLIDAQKIYISDLTAKIKMKDAVSLLERLQFAFNSKVKEKVEFKKMAEQEI